ncbi:hypothetical protein RGU70_05725 [Herbaspirillum sp. RTI4]|uniref:hypothetical protein n=1 Tax=Herbaspirillum sp. RTI4 TaxID=3048640 RepID=UPI002AB4DE7C|nr:hypothetical protein [Herbaspirillum sp. RTI4]MDY7577817.1 hypothetical protein [Herbaspirillum sp. RTI4]MEA9983431.1 hypothetical protein [Herbaspirillum sp. RTI4]
MLAQPQARIEDGKPAHVVATVYPVNISTLCAESKIFHTDLISELSEKLAATPIANERKNSGQRQDAK